ncbi:alpha/beta fold hydrolase [Nocardia arthritidis]|uniref:Alpha/beta fold hydrolase n=1 Tax=Nocardia arthritidis TaxID=228602 RepID=A0A6G9YA38_9NOCA|nr:alpha/beta hydrolase [Nocardia arthritidis]QIS09926.1 alpha/beta fold hydrolase [Nocardia arthritidis]
MPYLDTSDGTRLFYAQAGAPAAQPVVFLHAWALNSGMWNYQVPAVLSADMRCVVFDRRGHGRSDLPGGGYDLDRLADDLAELLAHLDLRDAVLVGHSMGSAEIIRYLSRHSDERVSGIVLGAPTTPFLLRTDDNPEGPVDAAAAEAVRAVMRRDIGAFVEATTPADWFGPGYRVSAGLGDWTRRQFFDTPLRVLLSTNQVFITADQRAELTGITVPALIIHGDADRSAALEHTGRRTHALLPDSRLVVIEGAGHGLFMGDPERYNREILDFIAELRPRGVSAA